MSSVAARGEDPTAGAQREETQKAVAEALERIPEHFRAILTLRDLQGCPYEEIAEVLELEIGTVKSRINRARMAFKDACLLTTPQNEVLS